MAIVNSFMSASLPETHRAETLRTGNVLGGGPGRDLLLPRLKRVRQAGREPRRGARTSGAQRAGSRRRALAVRRRRRRQRRLLEAARAPLSRARRDSRRDRLRFDLIAFVL